MRPSRSMSSINQPEASQSPVGSARRHQSPRSRRQKTSGRRVCEMKSSSSRRQSCERQPARRLVVVRSRRRRLPMPLVGTPGALDPSPHSPPTSSTCPLPDCGRESPHRVVGHKYVEPPIRSKSTKVTASAFCHGLAGGGVRHVDPRLGGDIDKAAVVIAIEIVVRAIEVLGMP